MTTTERIIRCPTCSKSVRWHVSNPWRPFCSERCQLLDLGAWASEAHRIPGEPAMDEQDPESRNELD
ncbi:MAG: DNA gyrase inhibitor YacG [Pseudomonadales bacterium]|nr:DNA gyrase inhibitor YacG [Pseudomonadales bacterium]MCP5185342.1 DNA gyrase inhibitor YacG [Pseudomonadales bacterium]